MNYVHLSNRTIRIPRFALWLLLILLFWSWLISRSDPAGLQPPADLTSSEWSHLQSLVTQAEYEFAWHTATDEYPAGYYAAPNHSQDWQTHFTSQSMQVTPQSGADWMWGLTLTNYGHESSLHKLSRADTMLLADGNTIAYQFNEHLSEQWLNTNEGLEQTIHLLERPVPTGFQSSLLLEMAISGDLTPQLQGEAVYFNDSNGTTMLTYDQPLVIDANGKSINAHFRLSESPTIQIQVNDHNANYPLTINMWAQAAKLTSSDSEAFDYFGHAVGVSGDTVVVGAPLDDGVGSGAGAVYVFVRPALGWVTMTETVKLTASDADPDDNFGISLAMSDDTIVVGADRADVDGSVAGAAYVFVRPESGWATGSEVAKLTASEVELLDKFGGSVAVSGDTVVIGASGDDDNQGAAYIFVRPESGWTTTTETAKLTASDAEDGDNLGSSVAISGDTVVAGAWSNNVGGVNAGSAYMFVRPESGWMTATETAKLTASDADEFDTFGFSVGVSDDTVVVGASGDDERGSGAGAVYVFIRPELGWATMTETVKLTASDTGSGDFFGSSVAISGNMLVVGANGDDDGGSDSGSAYLFVRPESGWGVTAETTKLTASDGSEDDFFGYSVAVDSATIVVGAVFDDDAGTNSGSAYVFRNIRNLYLPIVTSP